MTIEEHVMPSIDVESTDTATILTLGAAGGRCQLTAELVAELTQAVAEAKHAPRPALVIRGTDGTFCVSDPATGSQGTSAQGAGAWRRGAVHELLTAIRSLRVVTIAVVDGDATGAGLALALSTDLRLATPAARLGCDADPNGTFGYGLPHLLMTLGGRGAATRMLLGDTLDATQAARVGLVDRVIDPASLDTELERLLDAVPDADHVSAVARVMRAAQELPPDEAIRFGDLVAEHTGPGSPEHPAKGA